MTDIRTIAEAARRAARTLAVATSETKAAALRGIADALEARMEPVLSANAEDVRRAEADGAPSAVVDRLALDPERISQAAEGVREVAALNDPIGEVLDDRSRDDGLRIRKVRVPLGVIGVIYEGRPNVTVDAAALAIRSGNAALLRGSSIAERSNTALVEILRSAGEEAGLPRDAIQGVPPTRETAREMMRARGLLDLLIPRGGNDLIQTVVRESVVPVVETGIGNCHVYVDQHADLEKALRILVNAKVQRPGVCNAAESFLVHRRVADDFLPKAVAALQEHGVVVFGDERVRASGNGVERAGDEEYGAEFLDLRISGKVVDSIDDAIDHIDRYGTKHTEAIVTEDAVAAERFVEQIDAAAVMVNASTRFTDGFEFGMGAEIGISTQKLHARGPMALAELTTAKWIVEGDGHVRS
ncbi:MAG: glutamate-5-semialdehyde dehydrogenase [Actinomycetota bacterium]